MPELQSSITLIIARTSAVPVSIDPIRFSPIERETILAAGATPHSCAFDSLYPLAIAATCVP